jgi:hypothetical protein
MNQVKLLKSWSNKQAVFVKAHAFEGSSEGFWVWLLACDPWPSGGLTPHLDAEDLDETMHIHD